MLKLAVLLCILFLFVLVNRVFRDADTIKLLTVSISIFLFLYTIISGIFFFFDYFSFRRVVGFICIITFIIMIVFAVSEKKILSNSVIYSRTQTIVEIAIVLSIFLVSYSKFELYHCGQDQGLYQAEAIELYLGNFEVEHDFEEYQILEKEEDKDTYYEMVSETILGFYPLATLNTECLSEVSGMYHGIQTFPALLALGAKLFGLENMMQIQTIFFCCAALLLYYTLCNLGVSLRINLGCLAVFIFSPLSIWTSKTALTEMFLTLIMTAYLFFLTRTDSTSKRILLSLPLVCFSFVHVSFLLIYPIFVVINCLKYFYEKRRIYLYNNIIISLGLSAGYLMMHRIAPTYFISNCSRLYIGDIITADNFLYWVYLGCALVCLVSVLCGKIKNPLSWYKKIVSCFKLPSLIIIICLGAILVYCIYIGNYTTSDSWLKLYYGSGFLAAITHSALYAFAMATGFLVLVFVIIMQIVRPRYFCNRVEDFSIYLLMLYCVIIQSLIIRREVHYYYYYSRYLVFYIPIICLMLALIMKQLKRKWKWFIWAFSILGMLYFDIPLLENKDQTTLEWETLLDLVSIVEDDSAIIMENDKIFLLGPQLRALSLAAIFPVFDDLEEELELLTQNYTNVYYLGDKLKQYGKVFSDFTNVYRDKYICQNTVVINEIGIFPREFSEAEKEMVLYKYAVINEIMPSIENYYDIDSVYGLYESEKEWIWTNAECSVEIRNKNVKEQGLEIKFFIPTQITDNNLSEKIEIYVNGELMRSLDLIAGEVDIIIEPDEITDVDEEQYIIEIITPTSFIPAQIWESSIDERELALQLKYVGATK